MIAFAIQTAIFDSAGWSAIARPDLSSHNEVIGCNRMIQTARTVSLPPFPEPFGPTAVPLAGGEYLTKWRLVELKIRSEMETLDRCRTTPKFCPQSAQDFLAIIAEGRNRSELARIGVINRAINLAIKPMSDLAQWGVIDYWSSPLETFTTHRGDCEDYAISKYVALKQAGVDDEDLRVIIVRDLIVNENHAVVAARWGGKWFILDNRWLALVEDNEMHRLRPLFALNNDSVKQYVAVVANKPSVEIP